MRSNWDRSDHENLIQSGDWKSEKGAADPLNWYVGIAVNKKGKFY